jgi:antitoxin (DNA-binding transcriptional repressor) of toxin-antitoxin stability system
MLESLALLQGLIAVSLEKLRTRYRIPVGARSLQLDAHILLFWDRHSSGERSVPKAPTSYSAERARSLLANIASRAGPRTLMCVESHISAAEAAQTFPEMIERVRSHGEVFVVEQAGEPICRIAPIGPAPRTVRDLVRRLQTAARPDNAYLDAIEQIANTQPTLPETPWER